MQNDTRAEPNPISSMTLDPKLGGGQSRSAQAEPPDTTIVEVLRHLAYNPGELLIQRWNWKASLLSALIRATIYFFTNLTLGWRAAAGAMSAEFLFRIVTTGFYASLIQSFRKVQPAWVASLTVAAILPLLSLCVEFVYHTLIGTPNFRVSFRFSMAFTALSALFNLFAMRRGTIVVGPGQQSLGRDLRSMPRIVLEFLLVVPRAVVRLFRG